MDFLCRAQLRPGVEREYAGHGVNREAGDDVLFLNGRLLCLGDAITDLHTLLDKAVAVQRNGELVAARVTGAAAAAFAKELARALESGEPAPFPRDHTVAGAPEGVRLVDHLWDLVAWNAEVLEDDFEWANQPQHQRLPDVAPGAQLLHKDRILARENVRVEAGAILDASGGPIILGEGARVMHNAVVLGPAFIGPRSLIRFGAKIEGPVSIGPSCKVGGEVEGSILQGYANKQHDGYLGHAYLGAWTNLGAATNNSDLKNNYGTVRVWTPGRRGRHRQPVRGALHGRPLEERDRHPLQHRNGGGVLLQRVRGGVSAQASARPSPGAGCRARSATTWRRRSRWRARS